MITHIVNYGGMKIEIHKDGKKSYAKAGGHRLGDVVQDFDRSLEGRLDVLDMVDRIIPSLMESFNLSDRGADLLGEFYGLSYAVGHIGTPLPGNKLPILAERLSDLRLVAFWSRPEEEGPYLMDITPMFRDTVPSLFFDPTNN